VNLDEIPASPLRGKRAWQSSVSAAARFAPGRDDHWPEGRTTPGHGLEVGMTGFVSSLDLLPRQR
jgi:hypothetical protein